MRREGETARGVRTLIASALGFALATGAWLGVAGVATSGFAFSMGPRQTVPLVALFFVLYLVAGLVVYGRARRRGPGFLRGREARTMAAMAAVPLWVLLTVTFLPLKGSESFVRAGRLSTVQLNAIGLALVLAVGLLGGIAVSAAVRAALLALRHRLTFGGMRALGAIAAGAAIVLLLVGPGAGGVAPTSSVEKGAPRVAVIGVDGCDWEVLDALIAEGRLPTFARLLREGSSGPMMSIEHLVSPRIWTTIATGRRPEEHGILDFVNERGIPVNSTMRRAAPLWDIVSASGGTVGVIGWYVTWPAERVRGFLISDRAHSLLRGPLQILQSLLGTPTNKHLESFGHFTFDSSYKRYPPTDEHYLLNRIVDEPLRWGYLRDLIYSRAAGLLYPRYRPTFSAIYFRGVEFVEHFFWKFWEPAPFGRVDPAEVEAYGGVIPNYYAYQDRLLRRLLGALGDDVNVIIVSDHGFQARTDPPADRPLLTGQHERKAVLILHGPAFRSGAVLKDATVYDVAPTALAVMGLPVPEDMSGRVLVEALTEQQLAEHPIRTIPSYEPLVGRKRAEEIGSEMDESIRQQLRSLGYIE
jgi:hypothetical protein